MRVFFTTSPRLKIDHEDEVKAIYSSITELGHVHESDYIIKVSTDDFYVVDNEKTPVYYDEILASLKKADIVVFETSLHSLGVGLLIREALELGKGVIALHMEGNYPFLLGGMKDERLVIDEYNKNNIKDVLAGAFEYLEGKQDTRFNFFISPKIGTYLDWVSKKKRLPRAVYLRRLIEEDMKKSEYEG